MDFRHLSAMILGISTTIIIGCSSTSESTAVSDINVQREGTVITDTLERKRISVLASDLTQGEDMREVYKAYAADPAIINDVEKLQKHDEVSRIGMSHLFGDAVSGSVNSKLGTLFSMGSLAFNLGRDLFSGEQEVIVQRGFAPSLVDDIKIDSPDEARRFLHDQLESSLDRFVSEHNLTMGCASSHCDEFSGTYEIDVTNLNMPGYTQKKVYVFYLHPNIWQATEDPIRDIALGFKSQYSNNAMVRGFLVSIYGLPENEQGSGIQFSEQNFADRFTFEEPANAQNLLMTPMAQRLYNGIYSNPYMFMAIDTRQMKRIFYNGKVYGFNKRNNLEEGFVDRVIELDSKPTDIQPIMSSL
ncbi:hypothetical protein [Alteromonas sp. CYL-A6]|uniref:hypothetical protein n=1 Tax=Alteromonas nitratireducens TaxID=3390813 RepID=UPI0034BF65F3